MTTRNADRFFKEETLITAGTDRTIILDPLRNVTVVLLPTPDTNGSLADLAYTIAPDPVASDLITEVVGSTDADSFTFVGQGLTSIKLSVTNGTYTMQIRQMPYPHR